MRLQPPLARLAAGLLLLAGTACIDDAPTAASGAARGLALSIAGSAVQEASTILVRPFFFHRQTEARVELPVTPGDFELPAPGSENRVTVRLDACFRDGFREGDGGLYCRLQVELILLDAAGDTLASETQEVDVDLGDPGPIRVPPFGLRGPGGGGVGGVVRNAVTNEPLEGATVNVFPGSTPTNTPVATQTTGAGGAYAFALAAGTYLVQATAEGVIAGTFGPFTIAAGQTVSGDVVVSPTLDEGQTRVVLTWGDDPRDLDSHLFGPASAGNFHLFFGRRTIAGSGEAPATIATLDVDDTNGRGPETVTLLQQSAGTYRFAVHDYTNRGSGTSAAMSTSGARVRVFRGAELVAEFAVPSAPGTYWTVFDMTGTTITPINTMSFVGSPAHPAASVRLVGGGWPAASAKVAAPR